jgi:hypothetical protein
LSLPIGITTITITNLKNIQYIPTTFNLKNPMLAWTTDSTNNTLSQSSYNYSALTPTIPTQGLTYSFSRNNTSINGVGSITINYVPQFPAITAYLVISLPNNQSQLVSSACSMIGASNGVTSCTVVTNNSSSITVSYLGQTSTILNNVINIQPNTNLLQVSTYTINN